MKIIYENCCICMEDRYLITTECNHNFCVCCVTQINKCPVCRTNFKKTHLCREIKKYYIKLEQIRLKKIVGLFDMLPNFIDQTEITQANINVRYVYMTTEQRRLFAQIGHDYVITQLRNHTYTHYRID